MNVLKIKKISFCLLLLLISSACSKSEQTTGQAESSNPIISEITQRAESKTASTTQPATPDLPVHLGQEKFAQVQDSPRIKKLKTAANAALSVLNKKEYIKIGFDLGIYDVYLKIEENQPELKGNMAKARAELAKRPDYAPDQKIESKGLSTNDQQLVQAQHNAQLDLDQIQTTKETIVPVLLNQLVHNEIGFNSCISMLDLFAETVYFERKALYTSFIRGESFSQGNRSSNNAPPMLNNFYAMKKKCTQATNLITIAIQNHKNMDDKNISAKQLLGKKCVLESNTQIENGVDRYLCPSEVLLGLRSINNANLDRQN